MPAWPGGPCPECGEDMPERVVHCRNCRTMLNSDLESDSIEVPAFVPLQELSSYISLPIRGYYVACSSCQRELRINAYFSGRIVNCKHCSNSFRFKPGELPNVSKLPIYVYCPHCSERLRMSRKYVGVKVACRSCKGQLVVLEPESQVRAPSPK